MKSGGAGGIRPLDRLLQAYNGLANRRLQPLGHSSVRADMPDSGLSRKPQIALADCFAEERSAAHGRVWFQLRAFCATPRRHLVSTCRLLIACAGCFSNSPGATEGGTRGPSRRFAGIPAHAGEARALRSLAAFP